MKKLSRGRMTVDPELLRQLARRAGLNDRSRDQLELWLRHNRPARPRRPTSARTSVMMVRLWVVTRWIVRTRRPRYYREQWRILRP